MSPFRHRSPQIEIVFCIGEGFVSSLTDCHSLQMTTVENYLDLVTCYCFISCVVFLGGVRVKLFTVTTDHTESRSFTLGGLTFMN